mgnify:FL=1
MSMSMSSSVSSLSSNQCPSSISVNDDVGTVSDKISSWIKGISDAFEDKNVKIPNSQLREQYPRMPWHDVHASVAGLPARDLGAHFVMRWNHHKKSKGTQELRYLTDVSDITHFGVCAKCQLPKIFETVITCPNCGHSLGPVKRSLNIIKEIDFMIPSTLEEDVSSTCIPVPQATTQAVEASSEMAYITFRCQFRAKLGCRIQGDGPVLVTQIMNAEAVKEFPSSLLKREGENFKTETLIDQGLHPMIGDVIMSVNGSSVLHLNTEQLQRFLFLSKQKKELPNQQQTSISRTSSTSSAPARGLSASSVLRPATSLVSSSSESMRSTSRRRKSQTTSSHPAATLTVCFRRYYVDDIQDVVKADAYYKMMSDGMLTLMVRL